MSILRKEYLIHASALFSGMFRITFPKIANLVSGLFAKKRGELFELAGRKYAKARTVSGNLLIFLLAISSFLSVSCISEVASLCASGALCEGKGGSSGIPAFLLSPTTTVSTPTTTTLTTESYPGFTATRVYGQPDFTSNSVNNGGISATSANDPTGVALDSSGNVYIAEFYNNRILRFPSGSTTADTVYGQAGSFTTNTVNMGGMPNENTLKAPVHLSFDASGGMYVADAYNNRALYFPAGSTTATKVFGQPDFNSGSGDGTKGNGTNSDWNFWGIRAGDAGDVYITDYYNNRILYYPSGSSFATRIYGAGNESNLCSTVNASSICYPTDVVVDSNGGLYATDFANSRVLYFPSGSLTATRVYGQPDFTSGGPNNGGITASSLNKPKGIALDSQGGLYVSDKFNDRVLYYPPGSTTPTRVYGQGGDFTSHVWGTSPTLLLQPEGIALDASGGMYVADTGNHRILYFPPITVTK
ncbi:NHL repeat protein [Leptospira inadai serovar Lyme str. 10]|uniref:NHL repeat protein n=1 Tax=Leptospira inadai serovar Lyme str. 10 TaxID=1049790 RepID=V6HX69_9LEPT|nr:NHL repeat-containing protein [Leptospira inadai]EQA37594.1 NHL repeat protein [Leptospira inadai serovar Lyme str. 10]